MKGTNTIRFNMATVKEAMEEYLNRRLLGVHAVSVSDVEPDCENYELQVLVTEPKATKR